MTQAEAARIIERAMAAANRPADDTDPRIADLTARLERAERERNEARAACERMRAALRRIIPALNSSPHELTTSDAAYRRYSEASLIVDAALRAHAPAPERREAERTDSERSIERKRDLSELSHHCEVLTDESRQNLIALFRSGWTPRSPEVLRAAVRVIEAARAVNDRESDESWRRLQEAIAALDALKEGK